MTKIQLRRDTAANWSTNNPTPSAGEPCFETDTGKLKIGDGITAYNSLSYQGGTPDNVVTTDTAQTISGQKTFTGTNIFKGKSLNVGDGSNYTDVASFSGATYTVGDQKDSTIVNPLEIGASDNNTVLKSNVRVLETDTASSTKKAYSIMTKSPANNEYMSHMAMPSDKYIDLTLGASNSTYTAPANGWVSFVGTTSSNGSVFLKNISTNIITSEAYAHGVFYPTLYIPVRKNDTFTVYWNKCSVTSDAFRFLYAEGSSPTV